MNFQAKILIFSIITLISVSIFAVFKLYTQNDDLKILARSLYEQNSALIAQNANLLTNNKNISKELENTNDKFASLQVSASLNQAKNELKVEKKTEKIKVDSNIQKDFLRFIPNGMPLDFKGVTSEFGNRLHPVFGSYKEHLGIDLRAKLGTPVFATADGFVEYSDDSGTGYGFLVIITHNFGFKTKYAHLYNQPIVALGQFVRKGDLIAYSGNTGLSTGPHLHYEVLFLERNLNPYNFLIWNTESFSNIFQNERRIPWQAIAAALSAK